MKIADCEFTDTTFPTASPVESPTGQPTDRRIGKHCGVYEASSSDSRLNGLYGLRIPKISSRCPSNTTSPQFVVYLAYLSAPPGLQFETTDVFSFVLFGGPILIPVKAPDGIPPPPLGRARRTFLHVHFHE